MGQVKLTIFGLGWVSWWIFWLKCFSQLSLWRLWEVVWWTGWGVVNSIGILQKIQAW